MDKPTVGITVPIRLENAEALSVAVEKSKQLVENLQEAQKILDKLVADTALFREEDFKL